MKISKMKRNIKLAIISSLLALLIIICWLGLPKISNDLVLFYIVPDKTLSNFGFNDAVGEKKEGKLLFLIFPSLLCPAMANFVDDKKIDLKLKIEFLLDLLNLPLKYRDCVENILESKLKNDNSLKLVAAMILGDMGDRAVPALIEALKNNNDYVLKGFIVNSMMKIHDRRVIPILEECIRTNGDEKIYALIALYEFTGEEFYKIQIINILKTGSRKERLLAVTFMNGPAFDEKVIPLLRLSLRDKDEKLRRFAKSNIASILKSQNSKEPEPLPAFH